MLMALKALRRVHHADLGRNAHVRFRAARAELVRFALVIGPRSQPGALLHRRFRLLSFRSPAARGIFLAVDRCHMRRIFTEIRSPNSKLLAVFIDPFPELFGGNPSLRPCRAFDTHDIGRKPVAIAAAETAAMEGSVSRRLQAACDRLTVVIAERAGDAGRQPGLLRRVERVKKLQLEAPIHASDHVVHHRHAGFFRRLRILPREVLIDELGKGSGDSHRFALLLDRHFPPLMHLDGVLLGRPLVERPQELVDADFRYQALVANFDGAHSLLERRLSTGSGVFAVATCTGGASGGSICDGSGNAASTIDSGSSEAAVLSAAVPVTDSAAVATSALATSALATVRCPLRLLAVRPRPRRWR